MRFLFVLVMALAFSAASSMAAYDNSWFQAQFWSGEYPNGFAIVKAKTFVPSRQAMDKDLPSDSKCQLPLKAVFHPWNTKRNAKSKAKYFTASKIVKLTAKENFVFETDDSKKIAVKSGETLDFLIYGAEGWFLIKFNGKQYTVFQSIYEHLHEVEQSAYQQDEWLKVNCLNGKSVWVLLSDLVKVDAEGNMVYLPGVGDWSKGMSGYGSVHDLTDKDINDSK